MLIRKLMIGFLLIVLFLLSCSEQKQEKVSIRKESSKTLLVLSDALLAQQVNQPDDSNYGALWCTFCKGYHTRAAEAVYPFAVAYQLTGQKKYLDASIHLGNWLIRQQFPGGEWEETPEEWTGTTTDQLLMMVLAYRIVKKDLSETERSAWENSIKKAADYLTRVMSPDFASINYCATTTASLAITNKFFPEKRYADKARKLAGQVLSKMDREGFIQAEGDRVYGEKYGADVGYEIDMSLWGLGLYAKTMNDSAVWQAVLTSLKNHLYFVYPNGAIDGSWGIRSNKWTTYGSMTADGCQILFSLFAKEDPRFRTAALKNLNYLHTMMRNGLVGYGPAYWELFKHPPCIYPTFVRAKNLAMTVELGEQEPGAASPLPTQETRWYRHFKLADVVLTRSKNFMVTITANQYKELKKRNLSKYMHRPSGGSVSNLWAAGYGFLQLSSQTEYLRVEPMHFPAVEDITCITPRIEFTDRNGYFTNLYEFDGHISVEQKNGTIAVVTTVGELKDKMLYQGGVAYTWRHEITDNKIVKTVTLRYHGGHRNVRIVEPIVKQPGVKFHLLSPHTVQILGGKKEIRFEILEGDVNLTAGENDSRFWAVFPSVDAYPIILNIQNPEGNFLQKIQYQIAIQD